MPFAAILLAVAAGTAPFRLPDAAGVPHGLADWGDRPVVVVAFLGGDCPLSELYAARLAELGREYRPRGVQFVGVLSTPGSTPARLAEFAQAHATGFPLLRDPDGRVARSYGVGRVPEAVVLDAARAVRYRGRVDDQFAVGGRKPQPTRRDLAEAVDEVLAGRPVSRPRVEGTGCVIAAPDPAVAPPPDTRAVDDLLRLRCAACHRAGGVAPFPLTSAADAAGWAGPIGEAVAAGRMPPWHAGPDHGRFANDIRLSPAERDRLLGWLAAGAPAGPPPPPLPPPSEWAIREPDLVLDTGRTFEVPAAGVIDYQYFEVDPGFAEDRWVRAAEVLPGDRAAVHHAIVFIKPPGAAGMAPTGELGSVWLAATSPGLPPLSLPDGIAKRIPAGSRLVFQMHYTATGRPRTDRTRLGLIFADPRTVRQEAATRMALNRDLRIPPRAAAHRVEASAVLEEDVLLLSMLPHMHGRGRSFRYEAAYPDGRREVLLDIPRYDFGWQNAYVLAEPKRLPRGTTIACTAVFDNSAGNPSNPDPDREVPWGVQTTDEMMIGYFDVVAADQDLTAPPTAAGRLRAAGAWLAKRAFTPAGVAVSLVAVLAVLAVRRLRRPEAAAARRVLARYAGLTVALTLAIAGARGLQDVYLSRWAEAVAAPDPGTPRPIAAADAVHTEDMTWMEIRDALAAGKRTVIVGTGGVEQNGPYLVTGKHNPVIRAVAGATARHLGDALVAPVIPFVPEGGIDPPTGHMKYPGTLSVSESTYRRLLTELCQCWRAHGFDHVVLVGDSYDNLPGMRAVAEELDARWPDRATRFHYVDEYYRPDQVDAWLAARGIHQAPEWLHDDFAVTAVLTAIDPALVRMAQREAAGKASINRIDLRPAELTAEWGRRLILFRAERTAAAIRTARVDRPAGKR